MAEQKSQWNPLHWLEEAPQASGSVHIRKGNEYREAEEWELAEKCYREAIKQAETGHDHRAAAVALVHLAELHRVRRHFGAAGECYRRASNMFHTTSDMHNEGVTLRLHGMMAQQQELWDTALQCYRAAIFLFQALHQRFRGLNQEVKATRYEAWQQEVETRFQEVSTRYHPPEGTPQKRVVEGIGIQIIPVFSNVAAGIGIWLADEEVIEGYIRSDRVQVMGVSYQVVNLKRERQDVRIYNTYEYGASVVKGDSMNKANIEDGDIVIFRHIRGLPFTPRDRDIVVASVGEGGIRRGTVKHFRVGENGAWLEPVSDNRTHQPIPVRDDSVECIGEVVAVLKR